MIARDVLILAGALTIVGGLQAYAEECSLRGSVRSDDGIPAPGVTVVVTKGAFRPFSATAQTGADGSFAFDNVPCGRVRIMVSGDLTPREADTKRSEAVSLTVPRSTVELAQQLNETLAPPPPARALNAEEAEDERVADEFRARLVGTVGAPEDRKAFAAATTGQARRQAFDMAVARWMNAETGMGSQDGTSDASWQRRNRLVRAFVAGALGDAEVASFDSGRPRERTRMVLTASRRWLSTVAWPTTALVSGTEAVNGSVALRLIREALGSESEEARGWPDHLSPRWRGEAYRKALVSLLDDGLAFLDGGPPSRGLTQAMGRRESPQASQDAPPSPAVRPGREQERNRQAKAIEEMRRKSASDLARSPDQRNVAFAFGPGASERLGGLSPAEQAELKDLAGLYILGTMVALLPSTPSH